MVGEGEANQSSSGTKPLRPVTKIINYWNPKAESWQRHEAMENCFLRISQETVLPLLKDLPEGGRILDLASGANNSMYFPEGFDMTRVTALDVASAALRLNPSGKKVQVDARRQLPFSDNSFQLVTCFYGMRYFENQEDVIKEALRLLKPGGKLVIIDFKEAINGDTVRHFEAEALSKKYHQSGLTVTVKNLHKGFDWESAVDALIIGKQENIGS